MHPVMLDEPGSRQTPSRPQGSVHIEKTQQKRRGGDSGEAARVSRKALLPAPELGTGVRRGRLQAAADPQADPHQSSVTRGGPSNTASGPSDKVIPRGEERQRMATLVISWGQQIRAHLETTLLAQPRMLGSMPAAVFHSGSFEDSRWEQDMAQALC